MKNENLEADRELIVSAQQRGLGATLAAYTKLSGPGWLQGAITLGGGSLAGSLYVGVIGGYELMWLQPLMMILGVVMLSAISYVTLSTGRRPFEAINSEVSPVLGWGWIIATLMANLVWAMPQFSLGTAAIQQNLAPSLAGDANEIYCVGLLFIIAAVVVWFYDAGGWGIKIFDILLKLMVGVVVLCFFGVVIAIAISDQGLPWGKIFAGFVPNPKLLFNPSDTFAQVIANTSDSAYWNQHVLAAQRDRMVAAAATAVGINMTFLLPYSMLKRGWNRDFRGLATFDLSTGLFVPFFLATSCVVIAAAGQFHGKFDEGLVDPAKRTAATAKLQGNFDKEMGAYLGYLKSHNASLEGQSDEAIQRDFIRAADRQVAAMLIKRDSNVLALSLEELTGKTVAHVVFGVGVLGMAISTIIILMLINGFTICELLGRESRGWVYRIGCILPGLTGGLGAIYLWKGQAKFWLAVPTSIFGMALLPIAYITFLLMMNNRRLLGEHMMRGGKRLIANIIMLLSVGAALVGASLAIWGQSNKVPGTELEVRWAAIAIVCLFVSALVAVHFLRSKPNTSGADKA